MELIKPMTIINSYVFHAEIKYLTVMEFKEKFMTIEKNSVVSMHYKLTDDKGELIDESKENPLQYLHGTNSLIPGLEKELTGKSAGDRIQVTVKPEEAYGQVASKLITTLPLNTFEGVDKVEVGMEFEATGETGEMMVVRVDEINGEEVTINGNHPLAGMTLSFDVNVVDVRTATDEELNHGHAHDGSHHN